VTVGCNSGNPCKHGPKSEIRVSTGRNRKSVQARAEIVISEIRRAESGKVRKREKNSRTLIWEGGRLINLAEGEKLTNPNLGRERLLNLAEEEAPKSP
jgi:hypothetical protein